MIRNAKPKKSTHFKTRTGCVTCKARRIKCDEGRPECRKCKATGRHCDYQVDHQGAGDDTFEIVAFQHFRSSGALRRLDHFNDFSTSEELRFLGFFLYQTAYVLDGFTQPELWNSTILQMSYCEPAIRHLMLSLASLHELTILSDQDSASFNDLPNSSGLQRNYIFALQHQNKAISLVRERISSGKPPLAYILAACALFMCIEKLRGQTESAMNHLRSGVQLILARYADYEIKESGPAIGRISGLDQRCSTEKSFIILFSKLAVIQTIYGLFISKREQSLAIQIKENDIERPFENFDEIIEATSNIMSSVMSLENTIATDKAINSLYVHQQQIDLGRRLSSLKSSFEDFVAKQQANQGPTSDQDTRRWSLVRMYYILASIYIESGMSPSESVYDRYVSGFERMLELAEDVLGAPSEKSKPKPPFSLDLGLLSVLYLTGIKCRDPHIRRRAIDLLYIAPRLEGQGDALLLAKIARKIVTVEERGFEPTPITSMPPESTRIYDFAIEQASPSEDGRWMISMMTRPGGPLSDIVVLREEI